MFIVLLEMNELVLLGLLLLDLLASGVVLMLKGRSILALAVSIPLGVILAASLFTKVSRRVKSYLKNRRMDTISRTRNRDV